MILELALAVTSLLFPFGQQHAGIALDVAEFGEISGRITLRSGPTATLAPPVRRARVVLTSESLGIREVRESDPDGRFSFTDLPAGSYRIAVLKSGLLMKSAQDASRRALGQAVDVRDGWTTTINLVVHPAGAVAGQLWRAFQRPAPRMRVHLERIDEEGAVIPLHLQLVTDEAGRFRFHTLPAGIYQLYSEAADSVAGMSGEAASGISRDYYCLAPNTPARIRVIEGQEVSVDFILTSVVESLGSSSESEGIVATGGGSAEISGTVTAGDTGWPVAAVVRLTKLGGDVPSTSSVAATSMGQFRFVQVQAGIYELRATAEGFVETQYGTRLPSQSSRRIAVVDGQQFRDANMSFARTSSVQGVAIDEFGDPVPGIVVQLFRREFVAGSSRLLPVPKVGTSTTDDRGVFRLYNLEPGIYYLLALSGAFGSGQAANFGPTFYPGTDQVSFADVVTADVGQQIENLTIHMVPTQVASVQGRMQDQMGKPFPSGQAVLLRLDDGEIRAVISARAEPNADGIFRFDNVPIGNYVIQALGPSREFASHVLRIDGESTTRFALVMKRPTAVRGRIVMDGDSAPPSPADLRVRISATDFVHGPIAGASQSARVRDDGTFEVTGLSGAGIIRIDPQPPLRLAAVTLRGNDITDTPIPFDGRDIEGVVVTLTSNNATVVGSVTRDGRPQLDYAVVIFSTDRAKWNYPSRFVAITRPDQVGQFHVQALPPGSYRAAALTSLTGTEWQDPRFLERIDPVATEFVAGERETVTLVLTIIGSDSK